MRTFRRWGWLFIGLAVSAAEPPQAYFSGTDHIDQQIIRLTDQSRQTLDMALYECSSEPLMDALERAAARGVHIRMVLDTHLALEKKTLARLARIPALCVRFIGSRRGRAGHMHHKFLLIDGETLVTGSYNWTPGAEYVNYEDILVEDSAPILAGYEKEFGRLWDAGQAVPSAKVARPSMKRPGRRARKKRFPKTVQTVTVPSFF